jgi:PTH1 family peptidyl-tRNA hydrolase
MSFSSEFVLAGLGNPGSEYHETRHNVGFMFLDYLANKYHFSIQQSKFHSIFEKINLFSTSLIVIKPLTYMNLSGKSIAPLLSYYKIPVQNLIVVTDDLDQSAGQVRMRLGGGHGGHNGLRSILEEVHEDKFYRIKIGIGKPQYKTATSSWVTSRFSQEIHDFLYTNSFPLAEKRLEEALRQSKSK